MKTDLDGYPWVAIPFNVLDFRAFTVNVIGLFFGTDFTFAHRRRPLP